MSPLAMTLTFEYLKRGQNLSIKQCMEIEYRMACELFGHSDFIEGIRALLIEKD